MLRRSRRILYNVCLAFTDRRPENVDDLYQEIVCNLWRGWPKFRGKSDATSWVYRVALNTAGMELRRRKRRDFGTPVPIDKGLQILLADESDPLRERLYELIDKLPEDEKKLLFLHFDNLTNAQIAAITGKSESAIKQRLYRIRQKLLQIKKQDDEENR